jgi:hypothetical protein
MLAAQSSPVSGIVFAVIVLATSMALVAGLAWALRRFLGSSVGALRALIAALLGFVAALLLGRALQATQPGHEAAFLTVVLGVPLIVAMVFIVMAEVLVPTGTVPQPLEVIRGVFPAWAATARRGRGRRAGSAGIIATACAGRGRSYLHQARPAPVNSP